MMPAAARQRRLRLRRRLSGAKVFELWLGLRGQALVTELRHPGERLDALVERALLALQARRSDQGGRVTGDAAAGAGRWFPAGDYACGRCGIVSTALRAFRLEELRGCPHCGMRGEVRRV